MSHRLGRKKKERLASITTPAPELFPTNGPLSPGGLIGRQEEVSELVEAITEGEHQVLTGPGKIGKTSVAKAVVAALDQDDWLCRAIDLFHIADWPGVVARLIGGSPGAGDDSRRGSKLTFVDALATVDDAAAETNRRALLLIDGFEEIATTQLFGKTDDLVQEMRAAIDKTSRITCLFVGNAPCVMRDLFTSKDQPFAKFGTVRGLGPIPDETWRDGLRTRFGVGGCEISDAALDRLLQLSRGHARSTMLIAQWTYSFARAADRRLIDDAAAVDEGFDAAVAGESAVAQSELGRVRTLAKHALGTALRVARDESPYKNLPPAIARQTLRSLETAGIVEHPRSGAWQIVDPLFRVHLLRATSADAEPPAAAAVPVIEERPPTAAPTAAVPAVEERPPAVEAEPPPTEVRELEQPAVARDERVSDEEPPLDPARLALRHPRPEEGQHVGRLVAHVVASRRRNGHPGGTPRVDEPAAESNISTATGRRFGRFIERIVAHRPGWYWQLEAGRRPVAGVVLYRPRAIIGSGTTTGIDPLLQFVLLAVATTLSVGGLVLLLIKRSWQWGGLAGLLFAAFIACGIQAVLLGREVLGRAQASWIARRYGGTVVEGLWSEPDEAMPAVFRALASELPGTLLTAYADTPDRIAIYRDLGFSTGRGRVVAGVLSPKNGKPVKSVGSASPMPRQSRNGRPTVKAGATAAARKSAPVKTTHGRARPTGRPKSPRPHGGRPRGHR